MPVIIDRSRQLLIFQPFVLLVPCGISLFAQVLVLQRYSEFRSLGYLLLPIHSITSLELHGLLLGALILFAGGGSLVVRSKWERVGLVLSATLLLALRIEKLCLIFEGI